MNKLFLNWKTERSDVAGAMASGLCMLHCLATPFLFVTQSELASDHSASPQWWGAIDFVMLGVSLLAVYWSVKNTSAHWMKYGLWICWVALALFILFDKFVGHVHGHYFYLPAIGLVVLHLVNRKYCQCADDSCCAIES